MRCSATTRLETWELVAKSVSTANRDTAAIATATNANARRELSRVVLRLVIARETEPVAHSEDRLDDQRLTRLSLNLVTKVLDV